MGHWMDPITLISDKNNHAIEAWLLIEEGKSVDEWARID